MKKKLVVITLAAAFCLPNYSFAFGLGDITGSGETKSNVELEKGQGKLADETKNVMLNFITAYGEFRDALGLEEDSSLKEKIANCASEKICTEDDDMEKITASSEEINNAMKKLKDSGNKLSVNASETFKKGLVHYGRGIFNGATLGQKISEVGPKYTSAIAANPLTASTTFETGMTIVKQIPPVLSSFSGASGAIYNFATYNGIAKPEEADAE